METRRFVLAQAIESHDQSILDELVEAVGGCTAALIAEYTEGEGFAAIASRGLGADALRTLLGVSCGIIMLEAAVKHRCWVTQGGDHIVWKQYPTESRRLTARALQARARLLTGLAYPIALEDVVLGVVALYGRRDELGSAAHRAATRAVATDLAARLGQRRQIIVDSER
jgi:GAF domain-containing protein